jgi:hypothetical protein
MEKRIDWMDVKYALFVGLAMVALKIAGMAEPGLQVSRYTTDAVASVFTLGYIVYRARRQPEKLDEWGITTPLSLPLVLAGLALLAAAVGSLAIIATILAKGPSFNLAYFAQAAEYILSAFPQQFFMCSVGLTILATLRPFRGAWRLPLAVGLAFSLAHFWTPSRVEGTIIPFQMLLTLPMGFFAAYYFLKFRSILPLTVIHAIAYPLLVDWVEKHL